MSECQRPANKSQVLNVNNSPNEKGYSKQAFQKNEYYLRKAEIMFKFYPKVRQLSFVLFDTFPLVDPG